MNGHCKEFFPTIRLIITHNYGCKSKKRIITIGFGVMYMADDSFIRMMAISQKIPYVTTIAAASASVKGIKAALHDEVAPKSLQDYHKQK